MRGPVTRRWTTRATLLFILITCGAFWGAVALGLFLLLH